MLMRRLLFLCVLLGCAGVIQAQAPDKKSETSGNLQRNSAVSYRSAYGNAPLSANDLVEVNVFQEDDLTTKARVGQDGSILMPLIGQISVAGRSPDDAAMSIKAKLKAGYLVNPQVTVTIIEFAPRVFTVIGQVQKSGSFDMPGGVTNMDLLQAIGMAGGYTRIAEPKNVTITRMQGGSQKVYKVNAKAMAADPSVARFLVLPGDTVTVGESIF